MKEIVCLVPLSWDFVPARFFDSWTRMTDYAHGKYRLQMVAMRSPYLDSLRDILAERAMMGEPDYILWLDADQWYPGETPEKLIKHIDNGKLIVGGVTPHRGTGQPLIYDWTKPGDENKRVFQYRSKNNYLTGVHKVGGMGMGGVMVHPKVFRKLLTPPHFQMSYAPGEGRTSGEDVVFYKKCSEAGIDIWCDYDLLYSHVVVSQMDVRWHKDE